MKKVMAILLKIMIIIFAVIVRGIFILIKLAEYRENNYCKYTETVGEIETKYTAPGGRLCTSLHLLRQSGSARQAKPFPAVDKRYTVD